jgi:hypothetical protein
VIIDKANTDVTAYPVELVDDGYGGQEPSVDVNNPITFKAFAFSVGFSGAGWAINSKLTAQGWADVDRVRLIFRPVPGFTLKRWARVEFDGREWTVQEEPRFTKGFRRQQDYFTATIELRGDL